MKNNREIINLVFLLILLITPILPLANAITGQDASGIYTVNGQTSGLATNATGLSIRAIADFISSQFQAPSLKQVLYKGRFTLLTAINHAPNPATLIAPANDTGQNSSEVTFIWQNSTDTDNDLLSYYLEVYNDSSLTEIYKVNSSILETPTPTQTILNLIDEQTYYWRIIVKDSTKNSSSNTPFTFFIDSTPPTPFNLTSPPTQTSTTDNTPTLQWEVSNDTNLKNYTIEVATDENFNDITTREESLTTFFNNWTSALDADDYYWRIVATDKVNNQRFSDYPFLLTITAVTETTYTAGVTTAAGAVSPRAYSFHIIAPPSITIFKDESIIVPLNIENKGNQINLNRITLEASADLPGVDVTLDKTLINTLKPDTNATVNLIINAANADTTLFSVSVTANVDAPRLSDSIRILTSIIGEEETTLETAQQQLVFAKKFFDGNQECSGLTEPLNQAEDAIANGNYAQAHSLLTQAVNACKDLIAVKISKKPGLLNITINAIRENRTTAIISSQVLAFLIILLIVFKKVIRRKPKQPKLDF